MNDIKAIPFSNLMMDVKNPRFLFDQDNQDDAVRSMISADVEKAFNLAEDILEFGLSPFEAFLITPHTERSQKYIVLEGNRRTATLRMLDDPSKVESILSATRKRQLEKLSLRYKENPISSINCAIVDDRLEGRHWVDLRHQGQQKGAGIVPWGAEEKRRNEALYGKRDLTLQVLDYLEDHGVISSEERTKVPYSNLWRIVIMPHARNTLGYEVINNFFQPLGDEQKLEKYFKRIITDLTTGELRTHKIYLKENRIKYLDDLVKEMDTLQVAPIEDSAQTKQDNHTTAESNRSSQQDNASNEKVDSTKATSDGQATEYSTNQSSSTETTFQTSQPNTDGSNPQNGGTSKTWQSQTTGIKSGQPRETPSDNKRPSIIPSRFKLKIPAGRINDVYLELKALNVEVFTNATAVLLRVFLELSIDNFITRHQPAFRKNPDDLSYSLYHKFEDVGKYLLNNKILSQQQLDPVARAVARDSFLAFTLSTLHAYVHNPYFTPSPGDLRTAWNKLEAFIRALWEN